MTCVCIVIRDNGGATYVAGKGGRFRNGRRLVFAVISTATRVIVSSGGNETLHVDLKNVSYRNSRQLDIL